MADWRSDGAVGLLPDMPVLEGINPPKDDKSERSPRKGKKSKEPRTLRSAADKPVARIAVDLPLAHLDRPFDYLVPEKLADRARPGVRVRIRFAGQVTDGFLVARAASGRPGTNQVGRPADRRLPGRAGREERAQGQPALPGPGGLRRAGADR